MAEKILKKGLLHKTQTTKDVTLATLKDGGVEINDRMRLEAEVEKPKGLDKYVQLYILSEGICFKVNDRTMIDGAVNKAIGKDEFGEGVPVTFKTPAVKKGKYRWAYEIALAA